MYNLIGQISFPVVLYLTFLFFLIASVFSFFVGLGLALRSASALKFFHFMDRWVSLRKMSRPLTAPHYIEPTLLKHPYWLGISIIVGSVAALYFLESIDLSPTLTLFDEVLSRPSIAGIADNLKQFLIAGNIVCLGIGLMVVFFPKPLATIERYTDHWYTARKSMAPLERVHMEVDSWVLRHPTSTGVTLSILSFSVGVLMYSYMQDIAA